MKIIIGVLLLVLFGQIGYAVFYKLNKSTIQIIQNKTFVPVQEFQGKIVSFQNVNGADYPTGYFPEFFLHLQSDKDKKIKRLFIFDKYTLTRVIIRNSEGKLINYKKLKIGMLVSISKNGSKYEINIIKN